MADGGTEEEGIGAGRSTTHDGSIVPKSIKMIHSVYARAKLEGALDVDGAATLISAQHGDEDSVDEARMVTLRLMSSKSIEAMLQESEFWKMAKTSDGIPPTGMSWTEPSSAIAPILRGRATGGGEGADDTEIEGTKPLGGTADSFTSVECDPTTTQHIEEAMATSPSEAILAAARVCQLGSAISCCEKSGRAGEHFKEIVDALIEVGEFGLFATSSDQDAKDCSAVIKFVAKLFTTHRVWGQKCAKVVKLFGPHADDLSEALRLLHIIYDVASEGRKRSVKKSVIMAYTSLLKASDSPVLHYSAGKHLDEMEKSEKDVDLLAEIEEASDHRAFLNELVGLAIAKLSPSDTKD